MILAKDDEVDLAIMLSRTPASVRSRASQLRRKQREKKNGKPAAAPVPQSLAEQLQEVGDLLAKAGRILQALVPEVVAQERFVADFTKLRDKYSKVTVDGLNGLVVKYEDREDVN